MNPARLLRPSSTTLVLLLLLAAPWVPSRAGSPGKAGKASATLHRWLVAGPVQPATRAFGTLPKDETVDRLLSGEGVSPKSLWPEAGASLDWLPGVRLTWTETDSADGTLSFKGEGGNKAVAYASLYLTARRWNASLLSVESPFPAAVFLDGKQLAKRVSSSGKGGKVEPLTADLALPVGLHRLVVVTLRNGDKGPWTLKASLEAKESGGVLPIPSLSPKHPLTLRDVYATDYASRITVSGDGALVCATLRRADLDNDKWSSFLQVRESATGRITLNLEAFPSAGSPYFSPDGKSLAFQTPNPGDKKTRDLWLMDLRGGKAEKLLEGRRGVHDLLWAKGGGYLYFIAIAPRKRPKTPPPYQRFTQMYQRWMGWEDRPHAFALSLKDKSLHQLTSGPDTVQDMALSPDGKTLALLRTVHTEERPYLTMEIWTYDTATGTSKRLIHRPRWPDVSELCFSPDGKKIAFTASPTDMPPGGAKPRERIAYDFDLYVLDISSGAVKNLTAGFDPAVGSQVIGAYAGRRNVWWSSLDGALTFIATDKSTLKLYETDGEGGAFTTIDLPDTALGSPDMASSGRGFAYLGLSFGAYPALRYYDFAAKSLKTLDRPGREVFDRCDLVRHEAFTFRNDRSVPIEGWLFFPPGFTPSGSYPLVVAYYGGVFPYGQSFRPELFDIAGRGYVVYLLNPEGAVGYGPDFADVHMNDWGEKAGADIIQGVTKLLKAKPYLDAKHVGCYGGSYGGFMTLYLVGHSDLFAAAVDMYGISDITSYWGAGWWGFNYGDTAIANSYPWTRRDIFVKRSPVYFADKINTPLLILHGDSDTNVPPDEADQIFTALRVLGRTCEYVRFAGEDHGLHGKPSNALASDDMLFEWFDKYLKGQPEAWDARWKDQPKALER